MSGEAALVRVAGNPLEWQWRFGKRAKVLHEQQLAVDQHPAKEKYICWGRQSGKSIWLGENSVPRWALQHADTIQWLTSMTQWQANIIFQYMADTVLGGPLESLVKDMTTSPWPEMTFWNDSVVRARNLARDGVHVRGGFGDRLILDEAAFEKEATVNAVTPILSASPYAEQVYISTPNGLNWFWRGHQAGMEGAADIASFHMASWQNPFLNRGFLRKQRLRRSGRAWAIEWGATFVDDQNAPFPWSMVQLILDAELPFPAVPILGHRYVAGYDPANWSDRSGLVVLDCTTLPWIVVQQIDLAGIGWEAQEQAVAAECQRFFNCPLLMDASHGSVGDPLLAHLRARGVTAYGLQFTNQSKRELIEQLSITVEQRDLRIPWCEGTRLLQEEMKFYRAERNEKTGIVTFGALEGEHDDILTALALARHLAGTPVKTSKATVV